MKSIDTYANPFHDYMVRLTRPAESLPNLPLELICNILSHLQCQDLLQCQLASRVFRRLIVETSHLSYIIELHKSRMVSIVPHNDSSNYASRLQLLRERERNWRMLGWRRRCIVNLPPTGSLYEFVGGVYANGKESENRVTASISFLELPSIGIPASEKDGTMTTGLKSWTHLMPDYNIIDFTMDPVQDLLILVVVAPPDSPHVYDLHVRSIKTNRPHPNATSSVFPCLPKPDNHIQPFDVVTAVRVQVCGDLVALLIKEVFDNSGGYLEIWNWQHGPSQSCHMPRTNGIDDFTFLTHEVCLVVRPTGRFEIYDFVDPRIKTSEPVLRYALAFPPLSSGYTYWYISLSSNPTPGYVPSADEQHNMDDFLKGHQQIHYPRPEERVHACCLYVFNPADPVLQAVSSFVFFVKIDSLLNPPWSWFEYSQFQKRDGLLPYYNYQVWEEKRRAENLPIERGRREHSLPGTPRPSPFYLSPDSPLPSIDLDARGFPGPSTSAVAEPSPALQSSDNFVPLSDDIFDDLEGFDPDEPDEPSDTLPDPAICVPVPWDVWGPPSTRWFEECLSTDWQHAIYGMRAIESVEALRMSQERQFPIHEWHPKTANSQDGADDNLANLPSGSEHTTPVTVATHDSGTGQQSASTGAISNAAAGPSNSTDGSKREKRFLRMRDFSPYALTRAAKLETKDHPILDGKGRCRTVWRTPRIVEESSRVHVRGVFKDDIVSSLPYVETVTDEVFDVTDVMMDDCRLLLLKRGTAGRIKQMEVLMM